MRQFITRRITPSSRIVGGTAKNNKIGKENYKDYTLFCNFEFLNIIFLIKI